MKDKAMSLKAKIRNLAKEKNIAAQVVMQNYMFERFLERLAHSPFADRFVLKDEMLIAAMVGLDSRSTMDLDATIRNMPLDTAAMLKAMEAICAVYLDDDVRFRVISAVPIRKDDVYGGLRVAIEADYGTICTPLALDVSTGDAMTPHAVRYRFRTIFDEREIELWAYNLETVLAEKVETILRRSVFNTRLRDYYDAYILTKTHEVDRELFLRALAATAAHRQTADQIANTDEILRTILDSPELRRMWDKYCQEYTYAQGIPFNATIMAICELTGGDQAMVSNVAATDAFEHMQRAFAGDAERLGLKDEKDVVDLVKQVRVERREDAEQKDHP